MTFEKVLEMQAELDRVVGAPRSNGFIPGKRTPKKIMKSAIAECIEFDEETEWTHKTWKEKKEPVSDKKILEELVDILFFIAQYANTQEILKQLALSIYKRYTEKEYLEEFEDVEDGLLKLMEAFSRVSMPCFLPLYIRFYRTLGYMDHEILNEYKRKWEINLGRVKGDWSK